MTKDKILDSNYKNFKEKGIQSLQDISPYKINENRFIIFKKVSLYRQKGCKNWYCRIRMPNKEIKFTTKTDNMFESVNIALLEYSKLTTDKLYYDHYMKISSNKKNDIINNNEYIFNNKDEDNNDIKPYKIHEFKYQILKNLYLLKQRGCKNWHYRMRVVNSHQKTQDKKVSLSTDELKPSINLALVEYTKNKNVDKKMINHVPGCVYCAHNEIIDSYYNEEVYKIGTTNRSPHKRESSLSTSSPIPFQFKYFILTIDSRGLETKLHKELKHRNINKEFFKINSKELELIFEDIGAKLINNGIDRLKDYFTKDSLLLDNYFKTHTIPIIYEIK